MKHNLFKSEFVRNASVLSFGSLVAQLVPFLAYPLIGRLYSPTQAAILASFTSVVSIIQVVSTGKYEGAILLAKNNIEAANVAILSALICGCVCLGVGIPLLFFPGYFNTLLKTNVGNLIMLIPLSVFSISVFEIYNEWCVRRKTYKKLAANKISNAVTVNGGKVGFAYTPLSGAGLVLGDVFGRLATCLICITRAWLSDKFFFKQVSIKGIKQIVKTYSSFPKYIVPSQLLNTLGASLPILILNTFYESEDVGLFSMALAIMYVPISIIARSFRDVFRRKVRDAQEASSRIIPAMSQIFKKTTLLSIVVACVGVYFLPVIFSFFLGDRWTMSGVFAQIMTPFIVANFISTCIDGILIIAGKFKHIFIWQMLFCICAILPLFIGGYSGLSFTTTIWLYTAFRMIPELALILLSFYFAKRMDLKEI